MSPNTNRKLSAWTLVPLQCEDLHAPLSIKGDGETPKSAVCWSKSHDTMTMGYVPALCSLHHDGCWVAFMAFLNGPSSLSFWIFPPYLSPLFPSSSPLFHFHFLTTKEHLQLKQKPYLLIHSKTVYRMALGFFNPWLCLKMLPTLE